MFILGVIGIWEAGIFSLIFLIKEFMYKPLLVYFTHIIMVVEYSF